MAVRTRTVVSRTRSQSTRIERFVDVQQGHQTYPKPLARGGEVIIQSVILGQETWLSLSRVYPS